MAHPDEVAANRQWVKAHPRLTIAAVTLVLGGLVLPGLFMVMRLIIGLAIAFPH